MSKNVLYDRHYSHLEILRDVLPKILNSTGISPLYIYYPANSQSRWDWPAEAFLVLDKEGLTNTPQNGQYFGMMRIEVFEG